MSEPEKKYNKDTNVDSNNRRTWINPIGGLGDTLMVSGVLKQVVERDPAMRFMLVRRPGYMSLLEGHPAIIGTGFPEPDAEVISTDYWNPGPPGEGDMRPMQILARRFGLETPVEERFYVADDDRQDPLMDIIPWAEKNAVIAPGSISPRKMWDHSKWESLASMLSNIGVFTLQVGSPWEPHVRHAYSILGLTEPKQIFPILRRADVVITVDSFLLHAAYHVGTPAVVLWGPTHPSVYGYPGQHHLYVETGCTQPDGCIKPNRNNTYQTPCPMSEDHCVDQISIEQVLAEVKEIMG